MASSAPPNGLSTLPAPEGFLVLPAAAYCNAGRNAPHDVSAVPPLSCQAERAFCNACRNVFSRAETKAWKSSRIKAS